MRIVYDGDLSSVGLSNGQELKRGEPADVPDALALEYLKRDDFRRDGATSAARKAGRAKS